MSTLRTLSTKWLLGVAVVLSMSTALHIGAYLQPKIVGHAFPLEYREGAIVITTDLLIKGQDPYALQNQPSFTNVYGPIYNLIVLPFARVWGNGFFVHRAMNVVFVLASCGLMVWTLRRFRVSQWVAFTAAVLLYADLAARVAEMVPYAMPFSLIARPDVLGLLLFLVSVLVPMGRRFSHGSMVVACIASILAFYTKPYLVIGLPMAAAYVFLFRNKAVGVAYGMGFLMVLGGSFLLVSSWLESYVPIMNANSRTMMLSGEHLIEQLRFYATSVPGMLLALLITAAIGVRRLWRIRGGGPIGWFLPLDRPLFNLPVDFAWFAMVCSLTLLLWRLGRHGGQSMVYFYQLVTPFLLLIVFRSMRRRPWLMSLGIVDLVLLLGHHLPVPPKQHRETWDRWATLLQDKNDVCAPGPLAWMLREQGKPVYDNGMSEYFFFSTLYPSNELDRRVQDRVDAFRAEMNRKIRQEEFDLVIMPYSSDGAMSSVLNAHRLAQHYREVETIDFPMDWSPEFRGVVYVPRGIPEKPAVER